MFEHVKYSHNVSFLQSSRFQQIEWFCLNYFKGRAREERGKGEVIALAPVKLTFCTIDSQLINKKEFKKTKTMRLISHSSVQEIQGGSQY